MSRGNRTVHVLMLQWLAHGHVSPFLQLGKRLSERNFHSYSCSTPVNLTSIKPKISEKYSSFIELAYRPRLMSTLKAAFDKGSPCFSDIIKNLSPDLVAYDSHQPWALEIARLQNVPAVTFWSVSAGMASFFFHAVKNVGEEFPFEAIRFMITSNGTSTELEGKYMDYLSSLVGKRVISVGPLVQDPRQDDGNDEILKWLDQKEERSSVFKEGEEIAYGLELSNVNFIWLIRFPVGESMELEEALPTGFLERVGDRGLVREGWEPQTKILEHPSIGGFVSHCGWSSIMESMKSGVPIAMPMQLNQPLNARIVEEVGVKLEVMRDKSGVLERKEIEKVIKRVVVQKDGESVRKKAKEMSDSIRNEGERELDEMVDALVDVLNEG
ncbi:hypothetical protein BT93_J0084 [Corymbia citriodora subsp. variegata]|nr:hypothetical protein BT93_J0084 [Corymbia citriodora subsp. variegata]